MISNAKRVVFGIMALLLVSSTAYAGNVTFRCNMAVHKALGNFTPATQGVSAVGSFSGWGSAGSYALTDSDGDGIYEGTFSIADGAYEYKFVVTEGANIAAWEDGLSTTNRALTVAGDATLNVSEWNTGVKFLVDMTPPLAGGATFDPATQYVAVVGNINGWGGAAKDVSELSDANNDNIYEGRHPVAGGLPTIEYKFTIRNKSDNAVVTWESHGNRPLETKLNPSETVVVKWDKDAVAGGPGNITFKCNMAAQAALGNFTPASEGISVLGSFNGWGGADLNTYSLLDPDGDKIYEGTFRFDGGSYEYKFVVNQGSPKTIKAWEDGLSGNRKITVAGDATLDASEWNTGVKFRVNMAPPLAGGATFDPATQYVAAVGNLNGWGGAAREASELTDADGDNIYEGRHPVAAGLPNIEYKFTIRNKSDNAVATWENHSNRPLKTDLNPSETALVKWDSDPGVAVAATVLFQVNVKPLRDLGIFDETDGDSLVCYGGFNGWNGAAIDQALMRQSLLDPAIFEITLPITRVPGAKLEYKYFIRFNRNSPRFSTSRPPSGWEEPGSTGGGNRIYTFSDQTQQTVGVQTFADIITVVPKDSSYNVTFTADMRCALRTPGFGNVATDTLFFDSFDSFWHFFRGTLDQSDGESGPLIPFTDANKDSVYNLTLTLKGPVHNWMQYRLNWNHSQEAGPGFDLGRNRVRYARPDSIDRFGVPRFKKNYAFGRDVWNFDQAKALTVETEAGGVIDDPIPCIATAVEVTDSEVPDAFSLSQNYPNPFNPSTTIEYRIAKPGHVKLVLLNLMGQRVATLVDAQQVAGTHRVTVDFSQVDTRKLATGIYLYRLEAGDFVEVKKLVLAK